MKQILKVEHDDKNDLIPFTNDLQHNQWHIQDILSHLRRCQWHLQESLNHMDDRLSHIEKHLHCGFQPPPPPGSTP